MNTLFKASFLALLYGLLCTNNSLAAQSEQSERLQQQAPLQILHLISAFRSCTPALLAAAVPGDEQLQGLLKSESTLAKRGDKEGAAREARKAVSLLFKRILEGQLTLPHESPQSPSMKEVEEALQYTNGILLGTTIESSKTPPAATQDASTQTTYRSTVI